MKRLPANLATQPIEHRQWLRRVTLITAAVALALTLAQGLLAWGLIDEPETISPDAESVTMLRQWTDEVIELVSTADPSAARRVAIAVGLSNAFIDQRVFSWSGLFSILEESLPDDVRLEIIQPVAAVNGVRVTMTAASGSGDSLLAFLAALEQRPEFFAVYPGRQMMGIDGELRLSVEALARTDQDAGGEPAAAEQRP